MPLPSDSTEDDVEGVGESVRFPRWAQRHDEAGVGGGIAHAQQYTVTLVQWFAGDVHLRHKSRKAGAGDHEMDVRGAAGIKHGPDRAETVSATYCVFSIS